MRVYSGGGGQSKGRKMHKKEIRWKKKGKVVEIGSVEKKGGEERLLLEL